MIKNNIYIGIDSKESIASQICEYSLIVNTSQKLNINHIKINDMRKKNLYNREDDKLGSTEFTFTRFLVPLLNNYKGWALFCDSDFLWLDDVTKLLSLRDDKYAVMCVQHEYNPSETKKKLGFNQEIYPRKNWSSLVLWNCSHPSNKVVTSNLINNQSGKFMHRFGWLKDYEIGKISHEWNWLIGWYDEQTDKKPKALHFTEGGPWLGPPCNEGKYSKIWINYLKKFKATYEKN